MKVTQMTTVKGNSISNQFIITTNEGQYFQSYDSIIAFIPCTGKVQLDESKWDCSTTTGKYRNRFLGEQKKDTLKKIKSGEYEMTKLTI